MFNPIGDDMDWGVDGLPEKPLTARQARELADDARDQALRAHPIFDRLEEAARHGNFSFRYAIAPEEDDDYVSRLRRILDAQGFRVGDVKTEEGDGPHPGYDYFEVSW